MNHGLEHDLRRRHHGAPESLRSALTLAASDPALPRVTRRELARALDDVDPLPRRAIGVVPFPAVAPHTGQGLIYRATAADTARHDLTAVPTALATSVRAWLEATFPALSFAGLHLHVSGPPPGDGWSGRSCEAALMLAAVSWALRQAPDDVVVTGALGVPARLVAVDHLADKRTVVARDLPHARLVAADDGPVDALLDDALPGWRVALADRSARSLLVRARAARDALEAHDHPRALEEAERVLAADPDDAAVRARALWVRGAVRLHQGQAEPGLTDLDAAIDLLPAWTDHADDPAEDLVAEELVAWSLVARVDAGRVREAWTLGQRTLASLDAVPRRTRRWRWVALQVAGSTHRAALALGDVVGAHVLLRDWNLGRAVLADQRARNLGDHGEVRRRGGDASGAHIALEEARAALVDAAAPQATARFLDLLGARLDADAARPTQLARPEDPLWPRLGFELLGTRRGQADLERLHALPAVRASRPLQWVVGAEIAWHALHAGAFSRMIDGLRADLSTWTVDDTELAALLARLVARPTSPDLQAFRSRSPYG